MNLVTSPENVDELQRIGHLLAQQRQASALVLLQQSSSHRNSGNRDGRDDRTVLGPRIAALPLELRIKVLVQLDWDQVLQLCTFDDVEQLCQLDEFWYEWLEQHWPEHTTAATSSKFQSLFNSATDSFRNRAHFFAIVMPTLQRWDRVLLLDPRILSYETWGVELNASDVRFFARNRILRELHLDNSGLDNVDVQVLAQNSTLLTLSLQENNIDSMGAIALVRLNTTLQDLDLSLNSIDNRGAQALALSNTNTSLRALDLSFNEVGDAGAQALAQNRSLRYLLLAHNQVGDVGARALAQNNTLQSIDLHRNPINEATRRLLSTDTRFIF